MFSDETLKTGNRRLTLLALALTFGFAVIVGQLVRYQVVRHTELKEISDQQVIRERPVSSNRGYIADAHGRVLGLDVVQWDVSAWPPLIRKLTQQQQKDLSSSLVRLLDVKLETIQQAFASTEQWVPILNQVPEKAGEAVADLTHIGIQCVPELTRAYPAGELTSHITGIVLDSGEGLIGVEGYYNRELKPVVGKQQFKQTAGGGEIPVPLLLENPPKQGTSLVLTLDLNIQYIAAEELQKAMDKYQAESGSIIVMDPRTGAILASVSRPTYDPSDLAHADYKLFDDPAVSSQWEPGSIFKIITWAAGLDSGTITPNTQFNDRGVLEVGGRIIVNSDRAAHGLVTMEDGLLYSLNTVAAFISTSTGKETFYNYLNRFGFGSRTNVDLADEVEGMIKLPGASNWFPSDLGTNSFGQGLAVTPLQMISAVSAVANEGRLMKPYIVQEFITPSEQGEGYRVTRVEPKVRLQAISEDAAHTLTRMLVNVTEQSSSKSQVPGYHIAGKTGTAQIPTAAGYHLYDSIQSFIGYAPADDPQFVVLVKLDKPKVTAWASDSAAPTFGAIAQRLFLYLQIPPDEIRLAQRSALP